MGVGVLVAVSAVIGFNGWPGASTGGGSTPQAMLAASGPLAGLDTVRATEKIVIPEARRQARQQPRAGVRPVGETAADSLRTVRVATPEPDRATGGGDDRDVSQAQPAPKADPKPPAADPVRQVGNELGAATETTVKDLGQVVEPLSPTLGKAVGDVGHIFGDTVQGVTNTVSDLLDGVLKPTP